MVEPRPWTPDDHALWARLQAHGFEPPGQSLTFLARLARDHGWSLPVARQAVEEYRRFCFLAMTETAPVTPSEEVDEVWHLHLTYSRDYWERWCGEALGRPLHHQPTAGGATEGRHIEGLVSGCGCASAAIRRPEFRCRGDGADDLFHP